MFIQTESTPNPNTLKFIPDGVVNQGSPIGFNKGDECKISPLARLLFTIENVQAVFFGYDFISITKTEESNWDYIKPEVLVTVMEYIVAGKKILLEESQNSNENADDSEIVQKIKELIETRVRPAVAQDGGDIVYRGYEDGIVQLELHGACSGCPSSSVTLKNGIESMLKHYVPEIIAVEAVS